jgi:hypothetical protein
MTTMTEAGISPRSTPAPRPPWAAITVGGTIIASLSAALGVLAVG